MKLLFTPEALTSYNELKAQQSNEAELAVEVIKDIMAHPLEGKGNPRPLTGVLSGLWGRDYGVFRQLVYSFSDILHRFALSPAITCRGKRDF